MVRAPSRHSRRALADPSRGQPLRADQLDGSRPDQQPVPGAPYLAHTAATDRLLEDVLSQLIRFGDLLTQSVDDA